MKPKEPLLAVLLGIIFPGLGQIYSGKIKKAGILIGIELFILFLLYFITFSYLIKPHTPKILQVFIAFLFLSLSESFYCILVIVDGYFCTQNFNTSNGLKHKINILNKSFLILSILIMVYINPSLKKIISSYTQANIVQTLNVKDNTMAPLIQVGDKILADRALCKKSEPQRFDIVILKLPEDENDYYINRVIGLSDETVEIKNDHIYINGNILSDPKIENTEYYNLGDYGIRNKPVKIPQEHFFVLSDNSLLNLDSRHFGFVPRKNILGKVYKIYWPMNRYKVLE